MPVQLTILGSSGALPVYGRHHSSHYLVIDKHHFLIDCGEGTQLQLRKFSIPINKIENIFITHLHGDHYLGLMGLLFTMHLQNRTNDLHIYSQPGLDEIIILQLKHSRSVLKYQLIFHAIEEREAACIFEDEKLTVHTVPLKHKVPCTGFLFREKPKPRKIDKDRLPEGIRLQHIAQLKQGKDVYEDGMLLYKNEKHTLDPRHAYSYAYCSDTLYNENIVDQISGVDLLYHEASFMTEHLEKAEATLHTTANQAARIANQAKVKHLLIGHFSARYKVLEPLLAEAMLEFKNTRLAIEGETIDIETL